MTFLPTTDSDNAATFMFDQVLSETNSIAAVRLLRTALLEELLNEAEFCQTWRKVADTFAVRGNLVGLKLLLLLLEKAPARANRPGQLLFEQFTGLIFLVEGNTDKALYHFKQQLTLAEELNDTAEMLGAIFNLLRAALNQFRLEDVATYLETAEHLVAQQPNPIFLIKILNRQAELLAYQHRTQRSLEKAQQALLLARQYAQSSEEAFAWHWLGVGWMYKREWERSEQALMEALRLRQQVRDVIGRAETLTSLSRLYFKTGEIHLMNNCADGSLAIMRQLKNRPGIAQGIYWKAVLLYRTEQFVAALPLAMEAVELRLELAEPTKLAETFCLLGQIYTALGNRTMALVCYGRVLELHDSAHNTPQWIELLTLAGDYLLLGNETDPDYRLYRRQGLSALQTAIQIITDYEDLFYLAPLLGQLARGLLRMTGMEGVEAAQQCYRLQLTLLGDMDDTYFPPAEAIAQRAQALTGLQVCSSLLRRYDLARANGNEGV